MTFEQPWSKLCGVRYTTYTTCCWTLLITKISRWAQIHLLCLVTIWSTPTHTHRTHSLHPHIHMYLQMLFPSTLSQSPAGMAGWRSPGQSQLLQWWWTLPSPCGRPPVLLAENGGCNEASTWTWRNTRWGTFYLCSSQAHIYSYQGLHAAHILQYLRISPLWEHFRCTQRCSPAHHLSGQSAPNKRDPRGTG